ncbi:flagellar hook-length control protein FliK [Aureimonas psammosilenae]|uniref:flagellar hook-length control protein FliK n=1 Tax=Aureimonas psammosilenae TaxID=2495496 RepID=UPI00126090DE|nr:flagellar hook-length control protein FliK [Aureimonas psammosilenae]
MIASITAALPVGDAVASGPASATESEEAGAAFGVAVRNAGQKPEGRPNAKTAENDENKTGETGKGQGKHGRNVAKDEGDASPDGEGNGVPISAGDILGRLLGGTAFAAPVSADAPTGIGGEGATGGDEGPQERLVISTVVDLAGAVAGEMPKGQVALEVVKMETHFEPRLEGATLVDAEAATKTVETSAAERSEPVLAKDSAPADRTIRKGFEEILQTLGRPAASAESAGDDGQSDADPQSERGAGTNKLGGKGRTGEGTQTFSASPVRESETKAAPIGQIISSQVAEHIVEAFVSERQGTSAAASTPSDAQAAQLLRMTAGGAALKTLTIQLQPQDLGRLDVSMRLVDGRLAVELSASEPSTAQALASDRHTLRKLLETAGFTVDDAAITVVSRDMSQPLAASPTGNSSSDMQGGASDRRQNGAFEGRNGSNGNGSSSEQRFGRQREDAPERPSSRAAGSIFV